MSILLHHLLPGRNIPMSECTNHIATHSVEIIKLSDQKCPYCCSHTTCGLQSSLYWSTLNSEKVALYVHGYCFTSLPALKTLLIIVCLMHAGVMPWEG